MRLNAGTPVSISLWAKSACRPSTAIMDLGRRMVDGEQLEIDELVVEPDPPVRVKQQELDPA
jgi:hypothetical protein